MSENLMPPVLSQFGLISAIENLCEDIRTNKEIRIDFRFNKLPEKCDDHIKIYLYRIIQEALNNIVKHAEATKVDISLLYENDEIRLTIADNGIGFDMTKTRKSGNGINNMNDRAEILGGTFKLVSNPGVGTTIEVLFRINAA
jgi:signal transduction histidine kinase